VTKKRLGATPLPCLFERSEKAPPCGRVRLKGKTPHFVRGDNKKGARGDNKKGVRGDRKGENGGDRKAPIFNLGNRIKTCS
jgi:hypothetical protein